MVTIANRNDQMNVRDLQIFLSVAKHLNYACAAEEVNLSQPSVSVRMRELERDLGAAQTFIDMARQ
jgi:DNA-binding transcriptional LysR family regulator